MKADDLRLAALTGLLAVPIYWAALFLWEASGRSLTVLFVPDFAHQYPFVFFGAFLLSLLVLKAARGSWWKGGLWGGLLAPLNAPFSVLCILLWWQIRALAGTTEPWRYGWSGLFGEWQRQAFGILKAGLPLAVPCGILLGMFLGVVSARRR